MDAHKDPHIKDLSPFQPVNRRLFVAGSLLASGFAMATRPVSAQAITTDSQGLQAGEITIKAADREIPGYAAMPASGTNFPTILVVSEIFGVHAWVADICRRLAKQGHLAIAPEFFVRQGDVKNQPDIQGVMRIVQSVPDAQVMADLDAAVGWARASGKADLNKLAVTGFCWGGRITWLYSAHNPNLKAGVAWYGRLADQPNERQPRNALSLAAEIKAPVLGLYGTADQGIPVDHVEQMRAALRAANKPSEIILYQDAPHAFLADYRPSFRKEPAEQGWKAMTEWLKKHGAA